MDWLQLISKATTPTEVATQLAAIDKLVSQLDYLGQLVDRLLKTIGCRRIKDPTVNNVCVTTLQTLLSRLQVWLQRYSNLLKAPNDAALGTVLVSAGVVDPATYNGAMPAVQRSLLVNGLLTFFVRGLQIVQPIANVLLFVSQQELTPKVAEYVTLVLGLLVGCEQDLTFAWREMATTVSRATTEASAGTRYLDYVCQALRLAKLKKV